MSHFDKISALSAEISTLAANCERYAAYDAHANKVDTAFARYEEIADRMTAAREALKAVELEMATTESEFDEFDRIAAKSFRDVKSRDDAKQKLAESEKRMNQLIADVLMERSLAVAGPLLQTARRVDDKEVIDYFNKPDAGAGKEKVDRINKLIADIDNDVNTTANIATTNIATTATNDETTVTASDRNGEIEKMIYDCRAAAKRESPIGEPWTVIAGITNTTVSTTPVVSASDTTRVATLATYPRDEIAPHHRCTCGVHH